MIFLADLSKNCAVEKLYLDFSLSSDDQPSVVSDITVFLVKPYNVDLIFSVISKNFLPSKFWERVVLVESEYFGSKSATNRENGAHQRSRMDEAPHILYSSDCYLILRER